MTSVFEYNVGKSQKVGSIEVICGSMFSGKTEELIRRIKRARIAKQNVQIFKPNIDTRYSKHNVVSHDKTAIASSSIKSSRALLLNTKDNVDVIGIDEAQFMDEDLAEVSVELANKGIRVIIAGLDMDFLGKPFGPIPSLCAIADNVSKMHAICVKCGTPALFSHRLVNKEQQILLGETQEYEPLCRRCFTTTREQI